MSYFSIDADERFYYKILDSHCDIHINENRDMHVTSLNGPKSIFDFGTDFNTMYYSDKLNVVKKFIDVSKNYIFYEEWAYKPLRENEIKDKTILTNKSNNNCCKSNDNRYVFYVKLNKIVGKATVSYDKIQFVMKRTKNLLIVLDKVSKYELKLVSMYPAIKTFPSYKYTTINNPFKHIKNELSSDE